MITREGFYFYRSVFDSGKMMPPEERLTFLEAVMEYSLDGTEPELKGIGKAVFTAIKPVLDNERTSFYNGKKGGRGHKKTGVSENEKGAFENDETYKDKDKDKYKDKEEDKDIRQGESIVADAPSLKRFIKPSLEDIAAYAASMKYAGFRTRSFYDYYESNGWRVGRNPMKDWKAAVRNWHSKDKEQPVRKVDNIHNIGDFSNERSTI